MNPSKSFYSLIMFLLVGLFLSNLGCKSTTPKKTNPIPTKTLRGQTCKPANYKTQCPPGWGLCYICIGGKLKLGKPRQARHGDDGSEHRMDYITKFVVWREGYPRAINYSEFDKQGNKTRSRFDADEDGTLESESFLEYDASRNLIYFRSSSPLGTTSTRYEYNKRGMMIRESHFVNQKKTKEGRYRFNSKGQRIYYWFDKNGNGKPKEIGFLEYDMNGKNTRRRVDSNGDGKINTEFRQEYDLHGRLTYFWEDYNMDGKADSAIRLIYNANGFQIGSQHRDEDGLINFETGTEYNAQGMQTRYWSDSRNGRYTDDRIEYDVNGNKTRTYSYRRGTKKAVNIKNKVYDARGNLIRWDEDNDGDGKPEIEQRRTYNKDGNVLTGWLKDQKRHQISNMKYNTEGKLIHSKIDHRDGNGTTNIETHITYDLTGALSKTHRNINGVHSDQRWGYDKNGKHILYWRDTIGDTKGPEERRTSYNQQGKLIQVWIDTDDADGKINSEQRWEYNDRGDLLLDWDDRNGDGKPNHETRWKYNATGDLIRKSTYNNGDLKRMESYTYDSRLEHWRKNAPRLETVYP